MGSSHPEPIPVIAFQKRSEVRLELEVLSLAKLLKRHSQQELTRPQKIAFFHLIAVTMGPYRHSVDFHTVQADSGDLLLVAPGQIQSFDPNPDPGLQGTVVVFTEAFFVQDAANRRILGSPSLFGSWGGRICLQTQSTKPAQAAVEALAAEYRSGDKDDLRAEILRSRLNTTLLLADRAARLTEHWISNDDFRDYARFRDEVDRRFARTRKVTDYAVALGLSEKVLNRLTQQAQNLDAKEFIDARVVLEIRRLLVHTSLSVKEIAAAVGFGEPTNLVKFYRHRTGTTPQVFRGEWGNT